MQINKEHLPCPAFPSRAGLFSSMDLALAQREIQKQVPADAFNGLPPAEAKALLETCMLGVSLSLFALPGEDLSPVAKRCEVPSRRQLFRMMRVLGEQGSMFRREAKKAGASISERDVRLGLVKFARACSVSV